MKKMLLPLFALTVLLSAKPVQSQCVITNLGVNLKSFDISTCQVVFDLSWEQEVNNGNKYAYVHLWTGANYHTPAANWVNMYSNPSAYPLAADLVNSLGTIAIFGNGTLLPAIGDVYPPDELNVIPMTTGLSVTKTPLPGDLRERMTISNIVFILNSCADVVSVKADVWASQASNGKNVHCASEGLSFNLNNPRIAGFKHCEPRSVSFGITNNDPATPITVYYNMYKDDGDDLFEPGAGPGLDGNPILTSGSITILPLAVYSQSKMTYPGSDVYGETGSLWMEVVTTVPVFSFVTIGKLQDPGCIPLPVSLTSFSAVRRNTEVLLSWETASEYKNAGFFVERNAGNGWQQVAFVPTLAINGNSDAALSYKYTDVNSVKGITQYRLKQVDINGRSGYSDIRMVNGEGQMTVVLIYPNPTYTGKVNVVFDGTTQSRDIVVADMNGRVIRQLQHISAGNIVLENLPQGIFIVKVTTHGTRQQTAVKIVVNK